ncbi:MAG TPA: type II toxin-antitoxin system PemK/MazF family toxin [Xanthobacteraceae bacterium]|nr:type II toxin-antitoxin system PemK/MazF family toxin [Xanthobacteraceae bacterium]
MIWVDLDPVIGHEQSGRRPVIVLSPGLYNAASGLCVVCPVTSRVRGYPFEVPVPAASAVSGVVLADQVRSLSWERRYIRPIGRSVSLLDDVRDRVGALLGI